MFETLFHYLSNNNTYGFLSFFKVRHFLYIFIFVALVLVFLIYIVLGKSYIPNAVVTQVQEPLTTISSSSPIVVEISGAVNKPGVYPLTVNSRVFDILKLAEGFTNTADIVWINKNLSLASKLEDSTKIYVPFLWEDSTTIAHPMQVNSYHSGPIVSNKVTLGVNASNSTSLVKENMSSNNINSCSKDVLLALSGVGDVYAGKIIANRPYKNLVELKEKVKLPEKVINEIEMNLVF